MTKATVNPENKKATSHKGTRLTEARIALIVSSYIANGCNNKTDALVKAGYTYNTARYRSSIIFNDKRLQKELSRQMRPVIATGQITLINLQTKLNNMVDDIINDKDRRNYPTAISAINSLLKTIGGFQADRLPPENLAAKLLDTKKAEELNKALNAYYSSKYLACNPEIITVESTCKDTANLSNVDTLQPDTDQFSNTLHDVKTTETEIPQSDPITPQGAAASTTTSPFLTWDGFSEKGESDE